MKSVYQHSVRVDMAPAEEKEGEKRGGRGGGREGEGGF